MRTFSWRMPDDVRDRLEAAAHKNRRNLSDELVSRLRSSLAKEREQDRDPALRALNFVIAQLAERISGGMYVADREARLELQKDWRTDPFKFAAFKFAVGKLLDALEPPEPRGFSAKELATINEKELVEKLGFTPEFIKFVNEINKTPEAYGSYVFGMLWVQLTRTNPLTERERKFHTRFPHYDEIVDREFYGFQNAKHDLGINKSKSAKGD